MKNLNISGFNLLTKPANYKPTLSIHHSIIPAKTQPFNSWGETVRAEIDGKKVEDIALVKKLYL